MKKEDLFLAIGGLEASRLAKTEEEATMKSGIKFTRRLLIAAIITALLVGTAYAAAHFFLFDSPGKWFRDCTAAATARLPRRCPMTRSPGAAI